MINNKIKVNIVLIAVSLGLLTGCNSKNNIDNNSEISLETEIPKNKPSETKKKEYEDINVSDVPIKAEDIKVNFVEIMDPDSIGTVWMTHTITNNSTYNVVQVKQYIKVDDKNSYIATDGKLRPGKTSSLIKGFAPTSKNIEDIEPIFLEISILNDSSEFDNQTKPSYTYILYNYKTNEYKIKENVEYLQI